MRSLLGGGERAGSPQAPPMRTLRKRHRSRASPGDRRPFDGMPTVNAAAAGGAIGAHDILACVPDGDDPQLGRAFGPSPTD
jgi:hypothetical protein